MWFWVKNVYLSSRLSLSLKSLFLQAHESEFNLQSLHWRSWNQRLPQVPWPATLVYSARSRLVKAYFIKTKSKTNKTSVSHPKLTSDLYAYRHTFACKHTKGAFAIFYQNFLIKPLPFYPKYIEGTATDPKSGWYSYTDLCKKLHQLNWLRYCTCGTNAKGEREKKNDIQNHLDLKPIKTVLEKIREPLQLSLTYHKSSEGRAIRWKQSPNKPPNGVDLADSLTQKKQTL